MMNERYSPIARMSGAKRGALSSCQSFNSFKQSRHQTDGARDETCPHPEISQYEFCQITPARLHRDGGRHGCDARARGDARCAFRRWRGSHERHRANDRAGAAGAADTGPDRRTEEEGRAAAGCQAACATSSCSAAASGRAPSPATAACCASGPAAAARCTSCSPAAASGASCCAPAAASGCATSCDAAASAAGCSTASLHTAAAATPGCSTASRHTAAAATPGCSTASRHTAAAATPGCTAAARCSGSSADSARNRSQHTSGADPAGRSERAACTTSGCRCTRDSAAGSCWRTCNSASRGLAAPSGCARRCTSRWPAWTWRSGRSRRSGSPRHTAAASRRNRARDSGHTARPAVRADGSRRSAIHRCAVSGAYRTCFGCDRRTASATHRRAQHQ
jgi:hypothetical protein